MSTLPPLHGHEAARATLTLAARAGDLPGSLLIHGPAGVGKQRLGLWLGQLLLCANPTADGPCDACTACRLAVRLEHPDLHWFFPLPRPRGVSGPDRLADALEEARAAELDARRADPFRTTAPGEPVGLFLAQIQTIRRLAYQRPAMGRRKVFLIGGAEALVPQESSPEAANALLKVLEEPPPDTTLILTATDPGALLDTIRSRLLPVRLRALRNDEVADFLVRHRHVDAEAARTAARLAEGSIGRALGFLPVDGEPGPLETLRQDARTLLAAAAAPSPVRRLAAAHKLPPAGARGTFTATLDFLSLWLRDLAAIAAGAEDVIVNGDARDFLRDLARRLPAAGDAAPEAIRAVDEARALAYGNVNPQLILAHLLASLHRTLAAAT
ncbi:MAG TPA: DNA polymerase III subunit delta' C-terminal domain-containing protein [Longimicrobiales bacterium]